MRELASGLWHWTAPHPGWRPSEPWGEAVSSHAYDDGERLLLFDPLGVPDELLDAARHGGGPDAEVRHHGRAGR